MISTVLRLRRDRVPLPCPGFDRLALRRLGRVSSHAAMLRFPGGPPCLVRRVVRPVVSGGRETVGETWVFGYGSLVSPVSLATTIGRVVDPSEVAVATLAGYGRRWNYGAKHVRAAWTLDDIAVADGVMIALGLESSASESCNGVLVRVTDDDLTRLDRRERDYDRTDVTDLVSVDEPAAGVATATPQGSRFVTYVPRASAVERYETARDERRAAIRQPYWDLVRDAFDVLGGSHPARYGTTPAPDVPIVDMTWSVES